MKKTLSILLFLIIALIGTSFFAQSILVGKKDTKITSKDTIKKIKLPEIVFHNLQNSIRPRNNSTVIFDGNEVVYILSTYLRFGHYFDGVVRSYVILTNLGD